MTTHKVVVLWTDGEWRCEFHPGFGGDGRLEVYWGNQIVTAETTPSGVAAEQRGEILHQRAVRGDLRADT